MQDFISHTANIHLGQIIQQLSNTTSSATHFEFNRSDLERIKACLVAHGHGVSVTVTAASTSSPALLSNQVESAQGAEKMDTVSGGGGGGDTAPQPSQPQQPPPPPLAPRSSRRPYLDRPHRRHCCRLRRLLPPMRSGRRLPGSPLASRASRAPRHRRRRGEHHPSTARPTTTGARLETVTCRLRPHPSTPTSCCRRQRSAPST